MKIVALFDDCLGLLAKCLVHNGNIALMPGAWCLHQLVRMRVVSRLAVCPQIALLVP